MKKIEFTNPHRRKHFEFFNQMDQPHFSVCANVEITRFRSFLQKHQIPFTSGIVYLIAKTANAIPQFRQRIRNGEVFEHEQVHPSFTVLTEVADVFSFCYVNYQEKMSAFVADAQTQIEKMKINPSVEDEAGRDDFLFLSSFPWVAFTNLQHAMNYRREDSVPRIVWGKFFETEGQVKMPLSVQAHHAVVDGIHTGRYFEKIQEWLDEPELLFEE